MLVARMNGSEEKENQKVPKCNKAIGLLLRKGDTKYQRSEN